MKWSERGEVLYLNNKFLSLNDLNTQVLQGIKNLEIDGKLLCHVCNRPLQLFGDEKGWFVKHIPYTSRPYHREEDKYRYQIKEALSRHFQNLFPTSQVIINQEIITGMITDLLMITDSGGRLVIEVIGKEKFNTDKWLVREKTYKEKGIIPLLLGDARRVSLKDGVKQQVLFLKEFESYLLAHDFPLFYINDKRELALLEIEKDQGEIITPGKVMGNRHAFIYRYPLSQLQLQKGSFWIDRRWDK